MGVYGKLCRPFRACGFRRTAYPGRCPGLICDAPFGAEDGYCDRSLERCGSCHCLHSQSRRRFPVLRPAGAETNQPRATPEDQCVITRLALKGRNNMSAEYAAPPCVRSQIRHKKTGHTDDRLNTGSRWVWPVVTGPRWGIHSINEMIVPRGN
ncbi:MAG: hypothetical protein JWP89_3748 [Schlesneria sp.]|nr:hypothetical protein [Schlesneria sp.]